MGQDQGQQYLTFVLQKELYGVNIAAIKEIIEYGQLTEVPMMPASIRGVINLRGRVVPVIDLQARFAKEKTQENRRNCIIITEVFHDEEMQEMGLMVDAVNEVVQIEQGEIEPAPSFGASIKSAFIQGMGKMNGRFVILLNIGNLLSLDKVVEGNEERPSSEECLAIPPVI